MGKIQKSIPVKLFAGIISNSKEALIEAENHLKRMLGAIDFESPVIDFGFTDYYDNEMGRPLFRKWVTFEKPEEAEKLPLIKIETNSLEGALSVSGKRRVNIDPGYITLSKVVLASTKDFSHRICLSKGIYGEVTLIFKQKVFTFLPWTYPDYKSETALKFFSEIRNILHKRSDIP